MAKYDPLRSYLTQCGSPRVTMSFEQISELVGGLPRSAYEYQAWWANEIAPQTHVQKQAWMSVGFTVDRFDLSSCTVTYIRKK